jgi:HemY protein
VPTLVPAPTSGDKADGPDPVSAGMAAAALPASGAERAVRRIG